MDSGKTCLWPITVRSQSPPPTAD